MTRNRNSTKASVFHVANAACFLFIILAATTMKGCAGQGQRMNPKKQQGMQSELRRLNEEYTKEPRNADKIFMLAWAAITTNGINPMNVRFLKSAFDSNTVYTPLQEMDVVPMKPFLAAHIAGRYSAEEKDYKEAFKWGKLAYDFSKDSMSPSGDIGEFCTHLQLATLLNPYPSSNEDVDHSVAEMEAWANQLIYLMTEVKHKDVYLNNEWLASVMPGYANDPFVHCCHTLFPLSFYYRVDVAKIAKLNYDVSVLAFPELVYTAPHVKDFDKEQEEMKKAFIESGSGDEPPAIFQKCVDRKIKLGVISSVFSENHSVSEDFGGVLQHLDRNIFDISYHYLHEKSTPEETAAFLTANPSDKLFHYVKKDEDVKDGAWIRRIGKEIEAFEFDIIFYPDMTMSTWCRRLGIERLAPVQINSHGHPMTSGLPQSTMQHFVSWAEAELPPEESQTHYTEQLQLIPKGKLHQYYTPRVTTSSWVEGRISRVTNLPFDQITRKDFQELSPTLRNSTPEDDDIHVYVCMQKPFKLFPEFDELLCGILKDDPKGHAILHKETQTQTGKEDLFNDRLKKAGCDMDRVSFVSPQPAHRLMALYDTATVILDSYPAGGCTTTREALELGKPIVTWPARLLGGRWTLGLYNIIGIDEPTKERLIADSAEDYIAKAIELASNAAVRKDVENNIIEAIPSLFRRKEAVEEWEKIYLRVSPVKQCKADDNDGKDEL